MPPPRTQIEYELQEQRAKLANSYQTLLNEFASPELHTVGNYALGRLIGKGSFGKVYLASHRLTNGSKVVLKSANKDDANLAREIHHHRQFLHPHIARLYEVIVTEQLVWLVLEWCPGDELYNHLLTHGRMEAGKVQKIFTQLVGAVNYVHGKGCVHRDLKLENILLDKHDDVKLVDFGFTREYQGSTSYLQTWCGTVCYSAPEMLKGEKYAGEKVDVWSLGVILYALLCGELPFDEDDESETKALILRDDPKYPDYMPEPAKELIKKLLSKRALLRPSLADILKDPWLADFAPQQQEILKIKQPPPFSTQLERDVLQRMRSAGVNIDMVIEHVLAQQCDALAGWWALLLEKEQRKEKKREKKRKEREAEVKSIRRLSASSSMLLAASNLGEIHEGDERGLHHSIRPRGRPLSRHGNTILVPDLPKVTEVKSPGIEAPKPHTPARARRNDSRSSSRPPPPPKDYATTASRRRRTSSRGSQSMLRIVAHNPDLLSPSYIPPPERKRRTFTSQPLKEQLAWVKQFFKDGTIKRSKSPNEPAMGKKAISTPVVTTNGKNAPSHTTNELHRLSTAQTVTSRPSIGSRPEIQSRSTMPTRPRINTTSSAGSIPSVRGKRTSLSPHTLTPHSSYRRSSVGLRGRKSTSSSVSSIRSTYKGHQHTHSKASSNSDNSIASPSALSSASGSRLARSPHSSVKVLPQTPTNTSFPAGIRFSRQPPPAGLGPLPTFGISSSDGNGSSSTGTREARSAFGMLPPSSPGIPVFARRKRSVFKGPMMSGSSPNGLMRAGGSHHYGSNGLAGGAGASNSSRRKSSTPGRPSVEIIHGIEEEDEEAVDEEDEEDVEEEDDDGDGADEDFEEVDHFGPELGATSADTATDADPELAQSPLSPLTPADEAADALARSAGTASTAATAVAATPKTSVGKAGVAGTPLTAEALAKMEREEEAKEALETQDELRPA